MANDYLGLSDLQTIGDANLSGAQVSSILDDAPVLQRVAAVVASNGDRHKYLDYTAKPTVGYRAVNDGREHQSSVDTAVTIDLKILDASFTVDLALAQTYPQGVEALLQREALRHLRAAMFVCEQSFLNGTATHASGFNGLYDKHNALEATNGTCISAGGSTALTSVYVIRSNPEEIAIITGMNGNIEMGEATIQRAVGNTGFYPAYHVPVTAWYGLQKGGTYSSVRIANIGTDTGKGMTDLLAYTAFKAFKAGGQPNFIIMNRRSLEQLRAGRTGTNPTGAPAPRPTEIEGIPIIVTDAIGNAESAET